MASLRKNLRVERLRRLSKEGFWVVAGQVLAVLGSLVLVRVLTEQLDPTQYGQLALGLTVAGLVNQVVMGGVVSGIGRFYSVAIEKQDLHAYLRASRQLMLYATAGVTAVGVVLVTGLLLSGYSNWIGLAAAALVFSVLSGYNSSLSGIQNAARQRVVVAFHSGLDAWLKIVLALAMLYWLGNSGTAVVIGYAVSTLVVTGSQLYFLGRLIPDESESKQTANWARQMWAYSWPFSTWGVFTWAQQSSDRWTLEAFTTTQEVGLYTVLFQIGYSPIALATGMAVTFLGPVLFQRSGDATNYGRNLDVHRLTWLIALLGLVLALAACLFALKYHEWLFSMLVAAEYRDASHLLPWTVLAGGLFAAGQMLALKLMSEMKSAAMTTAKIVTAILGIGLNIYGASQFGLQGVVVALVAFSCMYFFWMIWLAQRPPVSVKHPARTSI